MTGFDETVPDSDDPGADENAVPEHDSVTPAVEDDPTPDEPPRRSDEQTHPGR